MKRFALAFGLLCFSMCSCSSLGLNFFSLNDDIKLGEEVNKEIQNDPATYPILSQREYGSAYAYLNGIRDSILDSGEVDHVQDFEWNVYLIDDDETLNAFATPGGYLYFYTGLLKYLDEEDHLAGVMAHEIAHAAERHSTEAMTDQYGLSLLVDALLGNDQNLFTDIAQGLVGLGYSRKHESQADANSVVYLSHTPYQCNGAAGFFRKLIDEGQAGNTPQFLSTHPNPDNRVEAINNKANSLGCSLALSGKDYNAFKSMLP